jgi:MFS family permease
MTANQGAAIAGWVADRSSSRRVPFVAGLVLAFLATLLLALAHAPWVLVLARALQGFSASIVFSVGLALIADKMDADEMGSW